MERLADCQGSLDLLNICEIKKAIKCTASFAARRPLTLSASIIFTRIRTSRVRDYFLLLAISTTLVRLEIDPEYYRPTEVNYLQGDPARRAVYWAGNRKLVLKSWCD
jgi:hypothetical protein